MGAKPGVHRLLVGICIAFDGLVGAVGQPQRDHPCHRSMLASHASADGSSAMIRHSDDSACGPLSAPLVEPRACTRSRRFEFPPIGRAVALATERDHEGRPMRRRAVRAVQCARPLGWICH
jgi:hypothetical protein